MRVALVSPIVFSPTSFPPHPTVVVQFIAYLYGNVGVVYSVVQKVSQWVILALQQQGQIRLFGPDGKLATCDKSQVKDWDEAYILMFEGKTVAAVKAVQRVESSSTVAADTAEYPAGTKEV